MSAKTEYSKQLRTAQDALLAVMNRIDILDHARMEAAAHGQRLDEGARVNQIARVNQLLAEIGQVLGIPEM